MAYECSFKFSDGHWGEWKFLGDELAMKKIIDRNHGDPHKILSAMKRGSEFTSESRRSKFRFTKDSKESASWQKKWFARTKANIKGAQNDLR